MAGYDLIWCDNFNLADVLPHSRNRLLLVATRRGDPRVEQLTPAPWQRVEDTPALGTILLPLAHACHAFAQPVQADVLAKYFSRTYLPRGVGASPHEIRRCRIRTAAERHPCIMANYAFSHELPEHVLREGGLIGTFNLHEGQLRWLSQAEIVLLFGCGDPCHVPQDPKVAYHMMGNAIAVPHAVVCLLNGLAQLECIKRNNVPLWIFHEALGTRFSNQNVMIQECQSTRTLLLTKREASPTLSWESHEVPLHCLRIHHESGNVTFRLGTDVSVIEFLRFLFHLPTNAAAAWQPRGDTDLTLPLFASDTVPCTGMLIENLWLGPLSLQESYLADTQSRMIVAFTACGILAVNRSSVETVDDLITCLQPHFKVPLQAQDHLGRDLLLADPPPAMLVIQCHKSQQAPDLSVLQDTRWSVVPEGFLCIMTMFQALTALQTFCQLGVDNVLRSFGWKSILDSSGDDSRQRGTSVQLMIQRCEAAASIPIQDLQNVLATRSFVTHLNHKLKNITEGIQVKVKLWDSYVWSGLVQPSTPTGVFAEAWTLAATYWGREEQLRTIIRGQRTNPEWEFRHYLDPQATPHTEVRVHMILELQGGGSKADAAVKAKEDFAARVLQVGFDPLDTKQFVQQLYQEAGAARMRTLLNIPDEEAFVQQCRTIAKQTRIPVPQLHDLEEARTKRVKSSFQPSLGPMSDIVAATLHVVPGTFCLHDGTEVRMCDPPQQPGEGIIFVEPDDIAAFVRAHDQTFTVSMAIVPGKKCGLQSDKCQRFHIPVLLPDSNRVIITACCHSLGRTSVTVKLSDGDGAVVTETTKTMFVTWKQDCPSEVWEALFEAPIHTVFKTLGIAPAQNISGPPFGRSWRAYRQQATPEEAESFCFYARVLAPVLHTVMKKSGMSGIYVTPKSEFTNLADSRFSVIWANFPTLAEAITKAETYDYTLGVVRSSKEKPAYGIRVLAKDFDVLWQDIRPSDPKPTLVQGEAMYKIAPVPTGATHDDVLKWIEMDSEATSCTEFVHLVAGRPSRHPPIHVYMETQRCPVTADREQFR